MVIGPTLGTVIARTASSSSCAAGPQRAVKLRNFAVQLGDPLQQQRPISRVSAGRDTPETTSIFEVARRKAT